MKFLYFQTRNMLHNSFILKYLNTNTPNSTGKRLTGMVKAHFHNKTSSIKKVSFL